MFAPQSGPRCAAYIEYIKGWTLFVGWHFWQGEILGRREAACRGSPPLGTLRSRQGLEEHSACKQHSPLGRSLGSKIRVSINRLTASPACACLIEVHWTEDAS